MYTLEEGILIEGLPPSECPEAPFSLLMLWKGQAHCECCNPWESVSQSHMQGTLSELGKANQ